MIHTFNDNKSLTSVPSLPSSLYSPSPPFSFFTSLFLCLAPSFSPLYPLSPLSILLPHPRSLPPFPSQRSDSALFKVCLTQVFLTQAFTLSLRTLSLSL